MSTDVTTLDQQLADWQAKLVKHEQATGEYRKLVQEVADGADVDEALDAIIKARAEMAEAKAKIDEIAQTREREEAKAAQAKIDALRKEAEALQSEAADVDEKSAPLLAKLENIQGVKPTFPTMTRSARLKRQATMKTLEGDMLTARLAGDQNTANTISSRLSQMRAFD